MGVQEIAALFGVSRQRADQISRQKGFPEPVAVLANGRQRVWQAADVRRWAKANDRKMPGG